MLENMTTDNNILLIEDETPSTTSTDLVVIEPVIDLKSITIAQKDHIIFANISLKVVKGEFVYLIGKVGSGKTSLIRTINAQLPLTNGEGTVAGFNLINIKNRNIPKLRRRIGVIFQDFQLLSDRNVHDNLEFVLRATGWKKRNEIEIRIDEVLGQVDLKSKKSNMPHQLSGGERQRVAIARALLNHPDVILADEPTGNLDPDTSTDILRLLNEIATQGCAVVMVTHNYTLLKKFSARTLRCDDGKLLEVAQSEEIDFTMLEQVINY
jgi:cell division transport system ATP-binding protein